MLKSSTLLTGHAQSAGLTWRSLYACRNGWRRLRLGCIDALELPGVEGTPGLETGYPTCCVLDGRDLGWTAAAGDAAELLVVDASEGVQVVLPLAPCASALPTGLHLADKRSRCQVVNCKTRQLPQTYSYDSGDYYFCMAPMPAGRIAAANSEALDMLALDMDGSELTSAGDARCKDDAAGSKRLPMVRHMPWQWEPDKPACASVPEHYQMEAYGSMSKGSNASQEPLLIAPYTAR